MKTSIFLLVLVVAVVCGEQDKPEPLRAIVVLSGKAGVNGSVVFTQTEQGSVQVEGRVSGLTPGKHGFHVHVLGDLREGCASTGGHFNPHAMTHGAPEDAVRHVGDLGNIVADETGVANIDIRDTIISLQGEHCILGRAVVVHEGEDDLGRGGAPDSLTTGHAGGRLACGVIGRLSAGTSAASWTAPLHLPLLLLLISASASITCRAQII